MVHVLDGGAHWRNLANTIQPSMCGSDAVFFVKLPSVSDGLLLEAHAQPYVTETQQLITNSRCI